MKAKLYPSNLEGKLNIITSKSFIHRVLILASFLKKETIIQNVVFSNDVKETINILRKIVNIKIKDNDVYIKGGIDKINCHYFSVDESASTLRFLIPLLGYYSKDLITIKLGDRLSKRSLKEYERIYKEYSLNDDYIFKLEGNILKIKNFPLSNYMVVDSKESSQYLTGILLLLSTLKDNYTINVKNASTSSYFIDETIEAIKLFNKSINKVGNNIFVMDNQISDKTKIIAPKDSSFELFITALSNNKISIVNNLSEYNKIDPAYKYIKDFDIVTSKDEIDIKLNSDVIFPLILYFIKKNRTITFKGIKNLRLKESDRIINITNFIDKLGYKYEINNDSLTIEFKEEINKFSFIDCMNDHRMVFLASLLSTKLDFEYEIINIEGFKKSYSLFFEDFKNIGLKFDIIDEIVILNESLNNQITNIYINKEFKDYNFLNIDKNTKKIVITEKNIPKSIIEDTKSKLNTDNVYILNKTNEDIKSFECVKELIDYLIDNNVSKTDYIIALGGGTITDLCGFISMIYKRGINLIMMPTTLLSMCDASIGFKCAINEKDIKNSVGGFCSPHSIIINEKFLETLPKEEMRSGMAEIIKIASITDENFFYDIYDSINYSKLHDWIIKSIEKKLEFVLSDPYDKLERHALNFGHTYGHVYEMKEGIKHGEAIAKGMSAIEKNIDLKNLLLKYEFNLAKKEDIKEINKEILNDKKIENGFIDIIKLEEIGKYKIEKIKL